MSNTRWYLKNKTANGLTPRSGELWFDGAVPVRQIETGIPIVEVKMTTPLSPSFVIVDELIKKLDTSSKAVSYQGIAGKMKLLQGEYVLGFAKGQVKALREGDYQIEIFADTFEGVQELYRDMMEGKITPKIVWRGADTAQAA